MACPTPCPPPYSVDYRTKCDLKYTNKSIITVLEDIETKYELKCAVTTDAYDVRAIFPKEIFDTRAKTQTKQDGPSSILQTRSSLEKLTNAMVRKHQIKIQEEEDDHTIRIGFVGSQDTLKLVIDDLKQKYPSAQIIQDGGIHVDFEAHQMPWWEVIGQLAQQSRLGIDSRGSIRLESNGRIVVSYGTFGPFYIYLSKEMASGKMVIDFLHSPSDMTNLDAVRFDNIDIFKGSEHISVKGQNITAQSSIQPDDSFEWESNTAVEINEGILKGTVSAWVLTGTFCVKNLKKDSSLKGCGLTIKVSKADVKDQPWAPVSVSFKPDKLEGEWMCIAAQAEVQMPNEQLEFIRRIDQSMLAGKKPAKKDLDRYAQLERNLPLTTIELDSPYLVNYRQGFESRAWFDSVKDANDVFPMDLKIQTYSYQPVSFSLPIGAK